jgi:hypothetical protein
LIDLEAIRKRATKQDSMPTLHLKCGHDRRELLALVDNIIGYVQHAAGCPPAAGAACDCGLDALLREMEGRE